MTICMEGVSALAARVYVLSRPSGPDSARSGRVSIPDHTAAVAVQCLSALNLTMLLQNVGKSSSCKCVLAEWANASHVHIIVMYGVSFRDKQVHEWQFCRQASSCTWYLMKIISLQICVQNHAALLILTPCTVESTLPPQKRFHHMTETYTTSLTARSGSYTI